MNDRSQNLSPEFISMNLLKRDKFIDEVGTYDFFNMFILLEGSFSCGKDNKTVYPGNVVIFHPGEPFTRRVIEPITFLSIHFESNLSKNENKAFPREILNFINKDRIISTANLMQKTNSKPMLNHYLTDILYQYTIESSQSSNSTNDIVDRAISIIESLQLSEINALYLSQALNISHAHLINLFKSHMGKTPVEYITDLKLQKAKSLLIDTEHTVQEISEMCGFASLYYFSRVFKAKVGSPPSTFRSIYKI